MYESEKPKKFYIRLLPIILMIGFIPMIVHMYSYDCKLSQFDWFPDEYDMQSDFFFAWKMYAIIGVGLLMVVILFCRHLFAEDQFRFEKPFALLGVYGLLVIASAVMSKYRYWVAQGCYSLFEPVWVVLIYLILCYYTYNYVREEHQVDMVLRWSGIGMAVVTLIGVFQYFGLDFFKTVIGRKLMTNSSYWDKLDSITFNFQEKTSYTTLYNPNFLSFYFGMLLPLLVCLVIGTKKLWKRILFVVACVLCLICLLGSGSSSGFMALATSGAILALVLLSRKKKTMIPAVAVFLTGIVACFVVLNTTSIGRSVRNTITGTYRLEDKYALSSIDTGMDNVTLKIHGNDLKLAWQFQDDGSMTVSCSDDKDKELELKMTDEENQIFAVEDKRFKDITLQPSVVGDEEQQFPCMTVTTDGENAKEWLFMNIDGAGYYYINASVKTVKYEKVNTSRLFKDDAMSGRGRIWNNTIPLIKKHILIGSGANTFLFEYPQNDYIGGAYIYANGINVKAHCWYLQQCIENGLLATLALLAFLGWYVIYSIRIYRRVDLHNRLSWVGFGLFAAVFTYLLTAIANDSNVCTAPVFWGMLGLGLAVNRMLVEKEKLFVKTENEENRSQ